MAYIVQPVPQRPVPQPVRFSFIQGGLAPYVPGAPATEVLARILAGAAFTARTATEASVNG